MVLGRILEDLYGNERRRILASLIRLTGDIDAAEDALQEAVPRALTAWRNDGLPDRPGAWLQTVAGASRSIISGGQQRSTAGRVVRAGARG